MSVVGVGVGMGVVFWLWWKMGYMGLWVDGVS